MKGLYEMLEGFDEKDFEEWRMEKDKRKKLLSEKEVMDAIAQEAAEAANAVFEEENRGAVMIRMVIKMNSLIEKLFREEEPAEEPDAEKPAEKTGMSALEELLFEQAYLARVKCKEVCSDIRYGRFLETQDLIRNAGLQEEYDAWKEEKGYE
mgnify:CR=1 FL=1